jgi:hypothetical protein
MEPKREALLAKELEAFIQIQIFFVFFKRARCKNQHHLQTKIRFNMRETYLGYSHISTTLGVCIARQNKSSVWSSSFLRNTFSL